MEGEARVSTAVTLQMRNPASARRRDCATLSSHVQHLRHSKGATYSPDCSAASPGSTGAKDARMIKHMSSERVRKLLAEAAELPTDERVELVKGIARTLPSDRGERLRAAWAAGISSLDGDGPQLESDADFEAFLDDAVDEASRV